MHKILIELKYNGIRKSIVMKKLLSTICLLSVLGIMPCLADDVYSDDDYVDNAYYQQGLQYLQSFQYTSAINEFKKALRENPADPSAKIGITNAYISRAAYYNNKSQEYQKAVNDLRSALFYMKYYDGMNNDYNSSVAISSAQQNLDNLFSALKIDTSTKAKLTAAKTLRAQGEFAASAYELFQIINDNQYRKEAYVGIGDIMKILGQNQKAVFYYENAVKLDDKNADLHLKLARAYEQIGNPDGAATEYNSALQKSAEKEDILLSLQKIWQQKVAANPNDAESHANLGVVYQKQKNFVAAMEEYQKAETLNPTNVNTRLNLATLYQSQKNYDGAIAAYNSIIQLYPNHVEAHIYKAQCLKELGQNQEAIQEYKLALGYDPNNKQAREGMFDLLKATMPADQILSFLYQNVQNQPLNSSTYYQFAYELHKANKLDDAITFYKETLKLDPANIDAYVNLSQVFRQQKKYSEAIATIDQGKKLNPTNTTILNQEKSIKVEMSSLSINDAGKLFEEGAYTKALTEYAKVQPATAESLLGMAASYQALGQSQRAIEYYKRALTLDPSNADVYYYLGALYSDMDNYGTARTYLTKAIAMDKNNTKAQDILKFVTEQENNAILEKALNLYDQKRYVESLAIINSFIAKNPNNGTAYYYRGLVYDAQTKYALAIADYQKTVKFAPDITLAHYSLALDLDSVGRHLEAKAAYQKYLSAKPEENDYTKYARKRISQIK